MPQAIRSGKRSHPRGPALRFEFQAFSAKRNDHRLIASPAEFACRSAQKPLSRNMVELQPDAVGIFEQQRIISRRPLILARRANDRHTERTQEAVQLVNVGALAGTKTQMMQADAILLERRAGVLGRRRSDRDCGATADAIIDGVGVDDRLQPKKRQQLAVEFAGCVRNSMRSGKYARCR